MALVGSRTMMKLTISPVNGRCDCWRLAIGEYQVKLSATDIYEAYTHRFAHEHFFRFGKQKMLLDGFQTPEDDREEKMKNGSIIQLKKYVMRLSFD